MTAVIGDNSLDITKQEKAAGGISVATSIADILTKIKDLNAKKKKFKGDAKALGFTAAQIDHLVMAMMAEDDQKVVDKVMLQHENLITLGLVKPAADLFDAPSHMELLKAKGLAAGQMNRDRVSGYAEGSKDDKAWLAAYDIGRKQQLEDLKSLWEKRDKAANGVEPTGADPFAEEPAIAEPTAEDDAFFDSAKDAAE